MAMRWRNEWQRTRPHRYLEAELRRTERESLIMRDNRLRSLASLLAASSDFTPSERSLWERRIQTAQQKAGVEMEEQQRAYWEYLRSCNK